MTIEESLRNLSENHVNVQSGSKSFGSNLVLDNVDFDVRRGECVVIIGGSGSGKTTLLRSIAALEELDSGTIRVGAHSLGYGPGHPPVREREKNHFRASMGMVFQQFNLFPHLTVMGNMKIAPVHSLGMSKAEVEETAVRLLKAVGLSDKVRAYPAELSGGQQQRAAIARALAMNPEVMLLDEVTSALDPELVGEVEKVIQELVKTGMTTIVVTHELRFADRIADRICFMSNGTVVECGPPNQVLRAPKEERTKAFVKTAFRE